MRVATVTAGVIARMMLLALVMCLTSPAQWLNLRTPGIPRLADGNPDLVAPTPKTFDGKPDLSGMWRSDPVEDGFAYARNIAADLGPEEIMPWATSLTSQRTENLQRDAPWARCLPVGMPLNETTSIPYRIIQTRGLVLLFHEEFDTTPRQIFTDGRELPKDPNPTWMGYSVGTWDGDTLVVETSGFNDKTWLDQLGHPHSERLRLTERFRRLDFGHMTLQITIDDPEAFTRPFTLTRHPKLLPDYTMLEYFCTENERDSRHMVGK
jgi:hypothetical protein